MGRRKFCKEPGAWRLKGEDTKLACSALVKTWGEVEEVWEGVLKRGSKRHEGKIGGGEEEERRTGSEEGWKRGGEKERRVDGAPFPLLTTGNLCRV